MGEYKYGAYGIIGTSNEQTATQSSTAVVYVGTAPIHLIRNYAEKGIIHEPVRLANLSEAQRTIGHSRDWDAFTLSEAVQAHFNNQKVNIGPIYVINVADPDTAVQKEKTVAVSFRNGYAEIFSEAMVLDTVVVGDKVEGVDFTLDYDFNRMAAIVRSMDRANPIEGSVDVTFKEVTYTITAADIIGSADGEAGKYKGLGALQLMYLKHNRVPNLLSALKWGSIPEVYNALVSATQQINGHWDAFAVADIPIASADTIQKAIQWKENKGYVSERTKVYFPKTIDALGNVYHLSTLAMVEMQRIDMARDGIPFETAANKTIPVTAQYFGVSERGVFDQQTGNKLAEKGISTMIFWEGNWVLWGDHTAAFEHGRSMDPRGIFETNMRMLMHITNGFQQRWGTTINQPMTLALRDTVLAVEQAVLDSLVSVGALLGSPRIEFVETANQISAMMNGQFRWDTSVTPTPPFKNGDCYVTYTSDGFQAFYGGEN